MEENKSPKIHTMVKCFSRMRTEKGSRMRKFKLRPTLSCLQVSFYEQDLFSSQHKATRSVNLQSEENSARYNYQPHANSNSPKGTTQIHCNPEAK